MAVVSVVSVDGDTDESPWTTPYDSADSNQYSADIQESLKAYRPNGTYKVSVIADWQGTLNRSVCRNTVYWFVQFPSYKLVNVEGTCKMRCIRRLFC